MRTSSEVREKREAQGHAQRWNHIRNHALLVIAALTLMPIGVQGRCGVFAFLQENQCKERKANLPPETQIVSRLTKYDTVQIEVSGDDDGDSVLQFTARLTFLADTTLVDSSVNTTGIFTYSALDIGRYEFVVWAMDSQGLVDPTPAIDTFDIQSKNAAYPALPRRGKLPAACQAGPVFDALGRRRTSDGFAENAGGGTYLRRNMYGRRERVLLIK